MYYTHHASYRAPQMRHLYTKRVLDRAPYVRLTTCSWAKHGVGGASVPRRGRRKCLKCVALDLALDLVAHAVVLDVHWLARLCSRHHFLSLSDARSACENLIELFIRIPSLMMFHDRVHYFLATTGNALCFGPFQILSLTTFSHPLFK